MKRENLLKKCFLLSISNETNEVCIEFKSSLDVGTLIDLFSFLTKHYVFVRELKELSSPPCLDLDMAISETLRVREIEVTENASGEKLKLLIKIK